MALRPRLLPKGQYEIHVHVTALHYLEDTLVTIVGQHDNFIGGFSLFVALYFANKCKSKGAKRGFG